MSDCPGMLWPQVQATSISQMPAGSDPIFPDANLEMMRDSGMIIECPFHPGYWLVERDEERYALAGAKYAELLDEFVGKYWSGKFANY